MKQTKLYKLLCVCESMATGIYFFLNSLLNSLCEDYDIVIVYAERCETPKNIREQFDDRIKLIKMDTFRRGMDPRMIWASRRALRKIIDEEKPDIIHLNSSVAGIVGRLAAAGSGIPVLYTPHLFSFMQPSFSPLKRFVFHTAEWFLARLGGYVIGVSESEYRAAAKLTRRAGYINNCIDVILPAPEPTAHQAGTGLKAGTSGRILPQKCPHRYAELAKLVAEDDIVWIGDGELKTELQGLENVRVLGWMSRAEVIETVRTLDVFLLLSDSEGLSISLLEAMEAGAVCIASDIAANRQVLQNGVDGFLVADAAQAAEVMGKIRRHEVDIDAIRRAAYRKIVSEYNLDTMVRSYACVYKLAATRQLDQWIAEGRVKGVVSYDQCIGTGL
ncbi:MAG: glycosyltransferase [Oscillospiraceae bacterium]|nr:glycosyltransferase [Oscillospiraceae bacterium]MBQ7130657.1 glycosyltransferase [Oscillospiraceae bacterium]